MAVGLTGQIFEEDYLQQFKQAVCKEMRQMKQKCVPVWQDEQAKMIREKWYNASGEKIHGEIVAPFFLEGGRITMGDVHYVVQKDGEMIPAGETEFAKDKTFSYCASNLREWIEEKTAGKVKAEDVLSFSLEDLRNSRPEEIADRLETVNDFGKVIVNAVCYEDMVAFALGYEMALERGKRFMFRSAAAVPKVLGRITDQPLLTRKDMIREETKAGGLIIAGSHVKKTTDQLNSLLSDPKRMAVEFNQHLILDHVKMEKEFERVIGLVNRYINEGHTTVVYTRRKRLDHPCDQSYSRSEISTNLTVEKAKKEGINVKGPFPADTLFKQAFDGRFHAVVTMYHDQGQIALKLKGFERGITIGGGLRLPATTCAHGTAHDIAWKGIASVQSLENAYRMVCRMAENG